MFHRHNSQRKIGSEILGIKDIQNLRRKILSQRKTKNLRKKSEPEKKKQERKEFSLEEQQRFSKLRKNS